MGVKFLIALFMICLLGSPCYGEGVMAGEAVTFFNEGTKAHLDGNLYEAEVSYQKSLLLGDARRKFCLNNLGVIYVTRAQMQKAESSLKQTLEIDPDYSVGGINLHLLYMKWAMIYKKKGNTKQALDALEKAYYYHPDKTFIIEKPGR